MSNPSVEPLPGLAAGLASAHAVSQDAIATIVIFGVTGDLAGRKLVPALYNLWAAGFLPERLTVVGVARKPKTDAEFRSDMCDALKKHSRTGHGDSDTCDPFVSNLFYHQLDFAEADTFAPLAERLASLEAERNMPGHRLFYLATGPEFFGPIVHRLGEAGLVRAPDARQWSRVVIEKPFGHDLESSRALNAEISKILAEEQIYRIDHYLGKETVQNIFAFRFANAVFEPLFNQKYVDHVQITVAETAGMEGRRGAFYDKTGALRDVIQNHALQLLCLVAMEPPAAFNAQHIRDEKVKVLNSVDLPEEAPLHTWCVRAQYTEGGGAPGYLAETGVDPASDTETYVALKLNVDNWRWAGVPFFIRTGKRLKRRLTEIIVRFKRPPTHWFKALGLELPEPNTLEFRIQPDEAMNISCNAKAPGMEFRIKPVMLDFSFGAFEQELPEAYERLLLDALRGDSTLFTRADEIDHAWGIVTAIRDAWKVAPPPDLYRPGSWGPPEAEHLFDTCEGAWHNP